MNHPRAMLACCALALSLGRVPAHPISMSTATVNVRDTEALAELRIMLEDLVLFHGLKADAQTKFKAADLKQAAAKHRAFLLKHFAIRDAQGARITGKVDRYDATSIATNGVFQAELMKRHIIYLIKYPLKPKQSFLTFTQNFGGEKAIFPSIMDFMVLQSGIWMDRPVQLTPGRPHTVRFDWINPPTAPPKNFRELKAKREAERQRRLGITSYSGLYSFIYLTPREVRHEILIPLLSLEKLLPIARKNPEFLEVAEQEAARRAIGDYFRERNPVTIDGIPVKPVLARLQFFGLDINDFALNARARRVNAYQARVGIILAYSTKDAPKKVELRWDTFHQQAPFLRSIVYEGDEKAREHFFVKDKPILQWTPKATAHPTLEPVKANLNAATLNDTQRRAVFAALHSNIYRAFDYHDDADIYDALAHSVSGDLLRQLYLQIKRGLLMAEQGGSRSRVEAVKLAEGRVVPGGGRGFGYQARWAVTGRIEHWGHIHTRQNEYEAIFAITPTPSGWKITDYELRRQKRLQTGTRLRSLPSLP